MQLESSIQARALARRGFEKASPQLSVKRARVVSGPSGEPPARLAGSATSSGGAERRVLFCRGVSSVLDIAGQQGLELRQEDPDAEIQAALGFYFSRVGRYLKVCMRDFEEQYQIPTEDRAQQLELFDEL